MLISHPTSSQRPHTRARSNLYNEEPVDIAQSNDDYQPSYTPSYEPKK